MPYQENLELLTLISQTVTITQQKPKSKVTYVEVEIEKVDLFPKPIDRILNPTFKAVLGTNRGAFLIDDNTTRR